MADELKQKGMAIAEAYGHMPPHTDINKWYDSMEPEAYDEAMSLMNFNEKFVIAKQVHEALALPKESRIFDAGCGTGVVAMLLKE
jgi:ubiquinone/menaquinone biosynthesis C-methylase UbiE